MKILMISDVYFPRVNGVSTSIATFRAELEARGHEVHLIAPDYAGVVTDDETRIRRIPARQLPFDPEDRLMRGADVMALKDDICAAEFDLIHIQTPFVAHHVGVRLARELHIPRVETYHTYFEEYFYHYLPFLPKALTRFAARSLSRRQCNELDALVVPSNGMLQALRGYGIQVRAEIIPTGLPRENFTSGDGPAFRARYGIVPDRPTMLYVGRVAFEKNIGFLLKVLVRVRDELPDALLLVAGEGPALAELRRETERMGLKDGVLFLGYLDRRRELPDCYRAADVFVFSSCTETQGLVLLEAMAQGVPVVALAEMGTRDVLRQGQGAAIPHHDVDEFAAAATYLLQRPAEAIRLGDLGRLYAQEWSAATLAEKMVDFYRCTIDRHGEVPTPAAPHAMDVCMRSGED